jgi:TRAP-type C4-dicarboxylate transport system permease small subunit
MAMNESPRRWQRLRESLADACLLAALLLVLALSWRGVAVSLVADHGAREPGTAPGSPVEARRTRP